MKRHILLIILLISILSSFGQVVSTKNNKVEVRDINGRHIASSNYANMMDAVAGDKIVVIWYQNDRVEVRTQELKYIASGYYSGISKLATSGTNIVLYYSYNKVEVWDMKLKFISSWHN